MHGMSEMQKAAGEVAYGIKEGVGLETVRGLSNGQLIGSFYSFPSFRRPLELLKVPGVP
jgi:hypothetical protein